ncbi:conserved hypothetical protein [Trichinella spiralis]|uniref:hypothetical protein n=1 Tax=Trichinella spiralis TaxID=6334 RepID=UPI0001EFEE28|nr:conserved hypothetical protein [Trichinella spiralis]
MSASKGTTALEMHRRNLLEMVAYGENVGVCRRKFLQGEPGHRLRRLQTTPLAVVVRFDHRLPAAGGDVPRDEARPSPASHVEAAGRRVPRRADQGHPRSRRLALGGLWARCRLGFERGVAGVAPAGLRGGVCRAALHDGQRARGQLFGAGSDGRSTRVRRQENARLFGIVDRQWHQWQWSAAAATRILDGGHRRHDGDGKEPLQARGHQRALLADVEPAALRNGRTGKFAEQECDFECRSVEPNRRLAAQNPIRTVGRGHDDRGEIGQIRSAADARLGTVLGRGRPSRVGTHDNRTGGARQRRRYVGLAQPSPFASAPRKRVWKSTSTRRSGTGKTAARGRKPVKAPSKARRTAAKVKRTKALPLDNKNSTHVPADQNLPMYYTVSLQRFNFV